MEGGDQILPPWRPVFLLDDEDLKGEDGQQSVDEPDHAKENRPRAGTYTEYDANPSDLRILTPFKVELQSRLGDSVHVVEFRSSYSLDSVPNEWKRKDGPLLWKIEFSPNSPNSCPSKVLGYVTSQELGIFYFPNKAIALTFLSSILGEDEGPGFEEVIQQRNNLTRLLG